MTAGNVDELKKRVYAVLRKMFRTGFKKLAVQVIRLNRLVIYKQEMLKNC
jgi:hypothetical protein